MNLTPNVLRSLAEAFEALGMLDYFDADLVPTIDRAERLHATAQTAPDRYKSEVADIRQALAAGNIDIDEATARFESITHLADARGGAVKLVREASGLAARAAERMLTRKGESIVTELLAPRVAELVEQTRGLYADLPADVRDADTALKAGTKTVKTWNTLTAACEEWRAIYSLVRDLRLHDVVKGRQTDVDLIYGRPENVKRARNVAPTLRLAALIEAGAEPRLFTEQQMLDQIAAEEAEARAAKAKDRAPVRYASRTLGSEQSDVEWALEEMAKGGPTAKAKHAEEVRADA